ncbi:cell division control protein 42 homolog isoform X2 [Gadus macrocephalus]|uniref:cell division control protein 42 homolog isoform X2 n=1 Tax=Gadus macrocephalus TaxID=80720 RepID=UPI0028CB7710|nr:cell division control protein 42 homolog isoform X2 [Gadus macrocephalus]
MLPQDLGFHKNRRVSDPVFPLDDAPIPVRRVKNRDFPLSAKRKRSGSVPERRVNCVLVGDGAVGKTSLVVSYTTNGYPAEYIPTAFDNFTVMVVVDGKPVRLQLCDMAGQENLEKLRPLCYRSADVFLLCYSVVRPSSFRGLAQHWVPEVRRHRPDTPLVLIGTQLDLREDVQVLIQLARAQETPVSPQDGQRLAREIGAVGFAECSALTQKNLKDAFDAAILASVGGGGEEEEEEEREGEKEEKKQQEESKLLTLQKKSPEKMRSVSSGWWRRIGCLVGEPACDPP